MSIAEKTSLAQRYLAIFHNHFAVLFTIGILLVIIAFVAVGATAQRWNSDNFPMQCCVMATFLIGLVMCADSYLVDTESFGVPSSQVTQNIDVDRFIIKYHKKLPILQRRNKRAYQQLQMVRGSRTYAMSRCYTQAHHQMMHDKHFIENHNARKPWIDMKFNSPIQVRITVKR